MLDLQGHMLCATIGTRSVPFLQEIFADLIPSKLALLIRDTSDLGLAGVATRPDKDAVTVQQGTDLPHDLGAR